jgi:hypothetical protein
VSNLQPTYESPSADIRSYIQYAYDRGGPPPLDDLAMDALLFGQPSEEIEANGPATYSDFRIRHPGENTWDGTKSPIWTPYRSIFGMLRTLQPGPIIDYAIWAQAMAGYPLLPAW